MNTFTKFKLTCAIALTAVATQGVTAEVKYNMTWEGQNGYTASGYFTYDDAIAGNTVIGVELTDFHIQAFDSEANVVGEFNFDDIGTQFKRFRFTFDSVGEKILLANEGDPWGKVIDPNGEHGDVKSFQVGGFTDYSHSTYEFMLASNIGCSSSYPGEYKPELDLYTDASGYCRPPMVRVDTGTQGSGISVTLVEQPDKFVAITSLPDINNNGYPEVAILKIESERAVVYIKDTITNEQINKVKGLFTTNNRTPIDLSVQADSNGNSFPEILIASQTSNGEAIIQIVDTGTLEILGKIIQK